MDSEPFQTWEKSRERQTVVADSSYRYRVGLLEDEPGAGATDGLEKACAPQAFPYWAGRW